MPGLREDDFISYLRWLIQEFPEYAEILELLIEEVQKGKQAQITAMLQDLNNEDW